MEIAEVIPRQLAPSMGTPCVGSMIPKASTLFDSSIPPDPNYFDSSTSTEPSSTPQKIRHRRSALNWICGISGHLCLHQFQLRIGARHPGCSMRTAVEVMIELFCNSQVIALVISSPDMARNSAHIWITTKAHLQNTYYFPINDWRSCRHV